MNDQCFLNMGPDEEKPKEEVIVVPIIRELVHHVIDGIETIWGVLTKEHEPISKE